MDLFVAVIAILFLQVWGADNPLHKDQWFDQWVNFGQEKLTGSALFWGGVFVPVAGVGLIFALLSYTSQWLLLPCAVVVLLYSFGRGEFAEVIHEYTHACHLDDWETGVARAKGLGVEVDDLAHGDWNTLHQHVLEYATYRGFERMFAVLFWFFLLGPLGALAYRLMFMFSQRYPALAPNSSYWLWVAEWPVARLLGFSFAVTGNFAGCVRRWRESLFCLKRPTQLTLAQSVLGALSVSDELTQTQEVTREELALLDRLYKRTLWFWLAAAAILILLS